MRRAALRIPEKEQSLMKKRIVSALIALIMLLALLPAVSLADDGVFTVTLLPGNGTGEPIVYSCPFSAYDSLPTAENAEHLQFYQEKYGCVGFKLDPDYCPDSFTAPDKYLFDGWDGYDSVQIIAQGNPDATVTARWKVDQLLTYGPINDIPKAARSLNFWLGGVKWRVIGQSDSEWLLISADVLGGEMNWNDAMAYSDTVYTGFSALERTTVLSTSKTDGPYDVYAGQPYTQYYHYQAADLSNANLFFLSAAEATFYFDGDEDRTPDLWWLRSDVVYDNNDPGYKGGIRGGGQLDWMVPDRSHGYARPAFRFDPSRILFSSNAVNGKPTPGSGFAAYTAPTAAEDRKLTLSDDARINFTATQSGSVCPGGRIVISYEDAPTGENEYVSAMICDPTGTPIYYASVPSEGEGEMVLIMPTDLTVGESYTLKVFCEQQNGDNATDYASAFRTFTLNVKEACTVTFMNHDDSVLQVSNVAVGETPVYTGGMPTCPDNWTDGELYAYVFTGWIPALGPVTENTSYRAQFVLKRKNIVTLDANDGSGRTATDSYIAEEGVYTLPKCSFIPPAGKAFDRWMIKTELGNGAVEVMSYPAGTTLTDLSGDLDVYAVWKPLTVVVSPENAGTVFYDGNALTATANEGYTFEKWEYYPDASGVIPAGYDPFLSSDNPYTPETVDEGVYRAVFTANEYRLTVQANDAARGTVGFSGRPATGRKITLTATANDGYVFREWQTEPYVAIDANNRFTMPPCDVTVTAVFAPELTDGYYLIGPDWTVGAIDTEQRFTINPGATGEYMLRTTLAKDDRIKVVHVTNKTIDVWYPDGYGTEYTVDAAHAGDCRIYFRPIRNDDWNDFGGHIYIESIPTFMTQSLTLSSEIGINFYVNLSGLGDGKSDASMTFTVSGRGAAVLQTKTAAFDAEKTDGDGYYGFTCRVNALQMADTVTATLHYGDGHMIEKTYSVKEYIEKWDETHPGDTSDTAMLIHALADYGHYAQPFLGALHGWTVGDGPDRYAEMDLHYADSFDADAIRQACAGATVARTGSADTFADPKISLVLDSETAIRVYFTTADGREPGFAVQNEANEDVPFTVRQTGDATYMVEIPGVKARWLCDPYTVVASLDGDTQTISLSAMSYVGRLLASEAYGGNTDAKNAVCALWAYAQAASGF